MVQLLSCFQGHYWEAPTGDPGAAVAVSHCPVCGAEPDSLPLLDLAGAESELSCSQPIEEVPRLEDREGLPIIEGYEIQESLGQSPTGVALYRARQRISGQQVLLEVVLARRDPAQKAWGSLRAEATALGRLTHPCMVRLLDAGESGRQMFYNAVEHVEGPTLAEYLAGRRLTLVEALALLEILARAIHHAHEAGVVHRSLKPASILLQRIEGLPHAGRQQPGPLVCRLDGSLFLPRITHFGRARRPLEGEVADLEDQQGLPFYLSPEQAWGRARDIGPASDIHALGVILYELVQGKPPYSGATPMSVLEAIQCREPPAVVRRLAARQEEITAVCRKCLAKAPRRRFASAADLADDLRRLTTGYPVRAVSVSFPRRAGMALRRHRVACIITLLAILAVLGWWQTSRLLLSSQVREEFWSQQVARLSLLSQQELGQARQRDQVFRYCHAINRAEQALRYGQRDQARVFLESCPAPVRQWEWYYLNGLVNNRGIVRLEAPWPIHSLAVSQEGGFLAAGTRQAGEERRQPRGGVIVWSRVHRPQPTITRRWDDIGGPVQFLLFYPDPDQLAILSSAAENRGPSTLEVRSVAVKQLLFRRVVSLQLATSMDFLDDSKAIAFSGPECPILLHNALTGDALQPSKPLPGYIRGKQIRSFSAPSEPHGLVVAERHDIALVNPAREAPSRKSRSYSDEITAMTCNPSLGRVAIGRSEGGISLINPLLPGQDQDLPAGHSGAVTGMAFIDRRLVSVGQDGMLRFWDTQLDMEVLSLPGFDGATALRFLPLANVLLVAHGKQISLLDGSRP